MCVRNKQDVNKSRSPKAPRSPYRRHLSEVSPIINHSFFKVCPALISSLATSTQCFQFIVSLQSMKLRLSRRVVPSARVNLNSYWNLFENLANQNLPLANLESPTINNGPGGQFRFQQLDPVDDNLINEILELGNK